MVSGQKRKNPAQIALSGVFEKESGSDLLSHRGNSAVPLALEGLTSEFGMGSGGAPPVKPPEIGIPQGWESFPLRTLLVDLSVGCQPWTWQSLGPALE